MCQCGRHEPTKAKGWWILFGEEEIKSFTFYFEPKFQQTYPLWSCALHTAVSFLSRGKIRKACLRGFPLDIPWELCPHSHFVTFPLCLSRNFLREKEGVHNCTKTESDFKRECHSLSFFFSCEIRYWESFTDVLIYIGKWFCRLPIKTLRQQIKVSRKYESFAV